MGADGVVPISFLIEMNIRMVAQDAASVLDDHATQPVVIATKVAAPHILGICHAHRYMMLDTSIDF